MPRRMFTSSCSSRPRPNSRRSRSISRRGLAGSRKPLADEVALQVSVEALDLLEARGVEPARSRPTPAPVPRPLRLVRHDLHRRGEIERGVRRARRDVRDSLAFEHLVVREARHLGAEHERRPRRPDSPPRPPAAPPRAHRARAATARGGVRSARPQASRPASASSRLAAYLRAVRAGRPAPVAIASACGSGKCRGATSIRREEAHRLHRARRAADVARMGRAHEHDAHARRARFAVAIRLESRLRRSRRSTRFRRCPLSTRCSTPRSRRRGAPARSSTAPRATWTGSPSPPSARTTSSPRSTAPPRTR